MRLKEKHPYQNDTDAKLFYTHCPFAMGFFAGEYAGYMHGLRRGAPAIQRPATRHADGKAVLAVSPYHAASYAPSRVASGLSFEVIAPVVNDDRLSNDFFWRKPLCIEALPRIAAIAKQRRHILRVQDEDNYPDYNARLHRRNRPNNRLRHECGWHRRLGRKARSHTEAPKAPQALWLRFDRDRSSSSHAASDAPHRP